METKPGLGLTAWLLLVLVLKDQSHGYELARRLQQHFGLFLPSKTPTAVYPVLDVLERDGLIERRIRRSGKGRLNHRVEYEATQDAEPALEQWLISPIPPTRDWRTEMLARIAAACMLAIPVLLTLVERYQHYAQTEVKSVERQALLLADQQDQASLVRHMALDELRRTLTAQITWAKHWHHEIEGGVGA
jgi:DNA-binding PadR family transcriptional regulator